MVSADTAERHSLNGPTAGAVGEWRLWYRRRTAVSVGRSATSGTPTSGSHDILAGGPRTAQRATGTRRPKRSAWKGVVGASAEPAGVVGTGFRRDAGSVTDSGRVDGVDTPELTDDRDLLRRIQAGNRTTGRQQRSVTTNPEAVVLHGTPEHEPMNDAMYGSGWYRVIDHG